MIAVIYVPNKLAVKTLKECEAVSVYKGSEIALNDVRAGRQWSERVERKYISSVSILTCMHRYLVPKGLGT